MRSANLLVLVVLVDFIGLGLGSALDGEGAAPGQKIGLEKLLSELDRKYLAKPGPNYRGADELAERVAEVVTSLLKAVKDEDRNKPKAILDEFSVNDLLDLRKSGSIFGCDSAKFEKLVKTCHSIQPIKQTYLLYFLVGGNLRINLGRYCWEIARIKQAKCPGFEKISGMKQTFYGEEWLI